MWRPRPVPTSLSTTVQHLLKVHTPEAAADSGVMNALRRSCALGSTEPHTETAAMGAIIYDLARTGVRGMVNKKSALLPLGPFWTWAETMAAFERNVRDDPLPEGWQDLAASERPAVVEFRPHGGCEPKGGPSKCLKTALGLLPPQLPGSSRAVPAIVSPDGQPNEVITGLMIQLFHFFFDNHELPLLPPREGVPSSDVQTEKDTHPENRHNSVLEVIVCATNAKAKDLVVKDGKKFRVATEDDQVDDLDYDDLVSSATFEPHTGSHWLTTSSHWLLTRFPLAPF